MRKAWKPPSSRPVLIYFEFRTKPSLITVICMDHHSPNKLFATKYSEIIRVSFFFISLFFVFLLFYVIINFYKNYCIITINFLVMKIIVIFFCSGMFRNDPACSGMFRVPRFIYALIWSEIFQSSRTYCSVCYRGLNLQMHTLFAVGSHWNNTECFHNGLVRELQEKQRKLSRHSKTMDLIDAMTNRNVRSVRVKSIRVWTEECVSSLRVARFL